MLTSVLPGFRHFRTPFAIGALVAFNFWTLFGQFVPNEREASGFTHRLYSLGELAGRPIVTAVLAVVIYLIGEILRLAPERVIEMSRLASKRIWPISMESRVQLITFANDFLKKVNPRRTQEPSQDEVTELAMNIQSEFNRIRMRLIANHLDVYVEYDRLESESEFRFNVAIISVLVWVSLTVQWSPWFVFGLLISGILYRIGHMTLQQANEILRVVP
ncbi:hypothetical protein [Streptomyces sp. NPDC001508]|uniref:hypothetical protein n=1 Tax=Streptomyces sp. NPDC001508 TaxID=3154656 RepID=UPI0033212181